MDTNSSHTSQAKTVDLTQEELYSLVWSVPMQRLAKRYGISDVALAKTCRKLVVPVPPRGYWRRQETGRASARPPLPKPRPGARQVVTLSLERKREPPPPSPDLAALTAHEALPENRILVAYRLSRPHALVRQAGTMFRQRPRRVGSARMWRREPHLDIRVTPTHLARALRIFDALIKALERRAIAVRVAVDDYQRETVVELFGEKIAFWLEERTEAQPHVPTEAETRAGLTVRRRWDHIPNGQLRFHIESPSLQNARKTWSDGRGARLEDLLNDFLIGLAVVADGLRTRTLCRKREREEQEEARRQQALAEQRRKEGEQRIRTLEHQVDGWTRAAQVRAFADEVERRAGAKGVPATAGTELGGWLAWTRRYADRLDPFVAPAGSEDGPVTEA